MSKLKQTNFDAQTAAAMSQPQSPPCPLCGSGFLHGIGTETTRHPVAGGKVKIYFQCKNGCGHSWTEVIDGDGSEQPNRPQSIGIAPRPDGRPFLGE